MRRDGGGTPPLAEFPDSIPTSRAPTFGDPLPESEFPS